MTVIILLIGISLCIALIFLFVFIWSVRNGQYDDTITPSIRMLFEDNGKKDARGKNARKERKSTQRSRP